MPPGRKRTRAEVARSDPVSSKRPQSEVIASEKSRSRCENGEGNRGIGSEIEEITRRNHEIDEETEALCAKLRVETEQRRKRVVIASTRGLSTNFENHSEVGFGVGLGERSDLRVGEGRLGEVESYHPHLFLSLRAHHVGLGKLPQRLGGGGV
ncbi:unnamed protein product [Sphagnum balticum]